MASSNWLKDLKSAVDLRLEAFFDRKSAHASTRSPDGAVLVQAVRDLTLRGGKRLRPAVALAGFVATSEEQHTDAIEGLGAALELLQSYLLIHDDWMDRDLTRRGGPAVHAHFRQTQPTHHEGDSLGILAGDLAGTFAWEAFIATDFPAARRQEALEYFTSLQIDVIYGQHLDIVGSEDVDRMHELKTGAYTVEGPLHLGALLADATDEQIQALRQVGRPLGKAFQVRDDLLGAFGDPRQTGKPAGSDLRAGKENAVVAAAKATLIGEERERLESVLGNADASDIEIAEVIELLKTSGIQTRLEQHLKAFIEEARDAIEAGPFQELGAARLHDLAGLLVMRDH